MLNKTEAGVVAQLLLFLPIKPDQPGFRGIDLRLCLRSLLVCFILFMLLRYLFRHRGSPRPSLCLQFFFLIALVSGSLSVASFTELDGQDWNLESYNQLLLRVITGYFVTFCCIRQISNLFVPIPGPPLARLTSLWKVYHVVNDTYREVMEDLHQKHG